MHNTTYLHDARDSLRLIAGRRFFLNINNNNLLDCLSRSSHLNIDRLVIQIIIILSD